MITLAVLACLGSAFAQCSSNSLFICDGCSKNYSLGEFCVGICPYGYTDSNYTCVATGVAPFQQFFTDFSEYIPFNMNTTNIFRTLMETFDTTGSPSPTKDRGFYFNTNEYLEAVQSFVPAPSLTIDLWLYAYTDGVIISISDYIAITGYLSYSLSYKYSDLATIVH